MTFQFPSNEFSDQYKDFIQSRPFLAKTDSGENHHIFPKSIFGENDIIVRLQYMDHFKAHWYLAKIYETAGMKREYCQMAKAFFQFIGVADYRKETIRNLSSDEIDELSILIIAAREENRRQSIGELNGFYGKKHSPETIAKIMETKSKRDYSWSDERKSQYKQIISRKHPDDIVKHYFYDPITLQNFRFSTNQINQGDAIGLVSGRYYSQEELLRRQLQAQSNMAQASFDWVLSGEDHHWYGQRNIYKPGTDERKRILVDEELPDGWEYGNPFTESHRETHAKAMEKLRGVPKDWVAEKINKNPEKIRKTAEKHRGMKRSDAAKVNIRAGQKKYWDAGNKPANNGKIKAFDTKTRKLVYIAPETLSEYLENNPHITTEKLYRVKNVEGNSILITSQEPLPEGYAYAKNSGR